MTEKDLMKKGILIICLIILLPNIIIFGQDRNIEAFTHPFSNIKQKVSLYYSPNSYFKELDSDKEAGWLVVIKQKRDNYFQIDIEDLKLYNIWVHKGDLGVVVQNHDSIAIPMYSMPFLDSPKITYVHESNIGLIYDISDKMLFIQIIKEEDSFFGWVERKYLCGNPYTTCN
ncbi:MAG: hypothetical protein ACK5M0_01520 [Bacteroidales bacterium]